MKNWENQRKVINGFRSFDESEHQNGKTFPNVKKDLKKQVENEFPSLFYVYRKCWYGKSLFCIADEVTEVGSVVLCLYEGNVVAVLPFNDFACAINIKNYEECQEKIVGLL
jgi:hypothetical protein